MENNNIENPPLKDEAEEKAIFEFLNVEPETKTDEEETEKQNKEIPQKNGEVTEEKPQQLEPIITNPHPDGWKYVKGCVCEKCLAHKNYQREYQAKKRAEVKEPGQQQPQQQKETEIKKEETAQEKLDREMGTYTKIEQPAGPAQQGTPPPVNMSDFVSGTMLLMALDYTFPLFAKYVIGFFEPKFKRLNQAGCEALQLTEKEKKNLEPMADELVKILFATIPPAWAFVFFWGTTTFYKVMMLDPDKHFDKLPEPKTKSTT